MSEETEKDGWVACWVSVGEGVREMRKVKESDIYNPTTTITSLCAERNGDVIEVLPEQSTAGLDPIKFGNA